MTETPKPPLTPKEAAARAGEGQGVIAQALDTGGKRKGSAKQGELADIFAGRHSASPQRADWSTRRPTGNQVTTNETSDISSQRQETSQTLEAPGYAIKSAADLGGVVRATRKRLGLNQQAFADLAGVGRRFISELEAGKPSLEIERVIRCCLAAGIDLSARVRSS